MIATTATGSHKIKVLGTGDRCLINPAYHRLVGHRTILGLTVREALPEVEGQGFLELFGRVFTTGETYIGRNHKVVLQRMPGGIMETRFLDSMHIQSISSGW